MDFEQEIDSIFLRKCDLDQSPEATTENKQNSVDCSKNVLNCVPLMLKHVKSLHENGQNLNKLFSNCLKFKNCLVYGKIIGKGMNYKSSYNYILDDGTESLFINVFRRTDDMQVVWKMENELQAVKRQMWTQNKKEIVDSLRNLILKSKEQIDYSNISMGSKVLVYGKPRFYRGETSLNVFHIIEDRKHNRDIEIHFKDYLVDWHINKHMVSTNS